jgi:hypothetical protein
MAKNIEFLAYLVEPPDKLTSNIIWNYFWTDFNINS